MSGFRLAAVLLVLGAALPAPLPALAQAPDAAPGPGVNLPPAGNPAFVRSPERIKQAQRRLTALGYQAGQADGVIGGKTREAIRAYQGRNNLPVTGELTEDVFRLLMSATLAAPLPPTGVTALMPPEQALAEGGRLQSYVQSIQDELREHGYYSGPASGEITARTREAIRAYQRDAGLQVSGIASEDLLNHLRYAQPPVYRGPAAKR